MDKKIRKPKLNVILANRIQSHNFDEAKELIKQGVNLTYSITYNTIHQNNYEAFKFLIEQNLVNINQIDEYDLYSVFMPDEEVDNSKFKKFFIDRKNNESHIKKLFASKEHIEDFTKESKIMINNTGIVTINPEIKFAYDLEMEMEDVIKVKNAIQKLQKYLSNFTEFKKHIETISTEDELMLDEIQQKINKQKEIYDNYIADRLKLKESLTPLYEQREEINKNIVKTMKKLVGSTSPNKNKLKGLQ